MSSGGAGPRPPPVTRCCSAPTQAAPRGSDHSPAGLPLGAPAEAGGHSRAHAELGGLRASDTTSSNVQPGYYLTDLRGQRPRASASVTRPQPELETHWPGWVESGAGRGAKTEWGSEREGWETTVGRFRGWGQCISGTAHRGGCQWLKRWKGKEPRVSRPWAGIVGEAGAGCEDRVRVPEAARARGQRGRGGRGERTQVELGWARCQHPGGSSEDEDGEAEKRGRLEAGSGGHSGRRSPGAPVDAALGSVLAPGRPHCPPRGLRPSSHSYLFIY